MPEIFRFYGFSFFFYSREHEPIHVHVEGAEGFAKYNYDGNDFVLAISKGLKNNELKKIKFVIDENKDIIISRWKEYFEDYFLVDFPNILLIFRIFQNLYKYHLLFFRYDWQWR